MPHTNTSISGSVGPPSRERVEGVVGHAPMIAPLPVLAGFRDAVRPYAARRGCRRLATVTRVVAA